MLVGKDTGDQTLEWSRLQGMYFKRGRWCVPSWYGRWTPQCQIPIKKKEAKETVAFCLQTNGRQYVHPLTACWRALSLADKFGIRHLVGRTNDCFLCLRHLQNLLIYPCVELVLLVFGIQ